MDWPVERTGKWAEPHYAGSLYPPFAGGSGYVVSTKVVKMLARNIEHLHYYQVHAHALKLSTHTHTHTATTFSELRVLLSNTLERIYSLYICVIRTSPYLYCNTIKLYYLLLANNLFEIGLR